MALKTTNKNRKKKEEKIQEINSKSLTDNKLQKIILGVCLLLLVIVIL